jgi:hypothetical protein
MHRPCVQSEWALIRPQIIKPHLDSPKSCQSKGCGCGGTPTAVDCKQKKTSVRSCKFSHMKLIGRTIEALTCCHSLLLDYAQRNWSIRRLPRSVERHQNIMFLIQGLQSSFGKVGINFKNVVRF